MDFLAYIAISTMIGFLSSFIVLYHGNKDRGLVISVKYLSDCPEFIDSAYYADVVLFQPNKQKYTRIQMKYLKNNTPNLKSLIGQWATFSYGVSSKDIVHIFVQGDAGKYKYWSYKLEDK